MKAGWLAVLVAAVALAGCTDNANPGLAAPKLVLAPRQDGGIEIFIHAAFGERLYDRLTLVIDNESLASDAEVFSVERTLSKTSFYFDATAQTPRETYGVRGQAALQPQEDQFEIAFHADDGTWTDPEDYNAPFERVMSVREVVGP